MEKSDPWSSYTPRTGSPTGERNPFGDENKATPAASIRNYRSNPFATPNISRPGSAHSSAIDRQEPRAQRYFHSRRVKKGEIEKPWLSKRDPKEKWVTLIPIIGIILGLCVCGVLVWDGIRSVVKHNYCLVLEDDFSGGFNADKWTKEVQVGGFGNGEFEETTSDDENVFVENGVLMIKPTLQDATLMEKDNVIDHLQDGTCTSTVFSDCVAATNTTAGNNTVVPPVKSGRINTKKSATIKYGRVEVLAKLPQGDWLWPAIWMMPVSNVYGAWPASGEIDLMEARGNNHTYAQGGNNIISSTLHWGPDKTNDAWWMTNVKRPSLHSTYSADFNLFGVEWSQKYIFTYVNSRLYQVLYSDFSKQTLWARGNFPTSGTNGTMISDPWSETGNFNTPFDQPFYLILNVAVGGTNGWFADGASGKPWADASSSAKKDFWNAKDQWLPTWTSPAMQVKKVTMWQQCDGGEL